MIAQVKIKIQKMKQNKKTNLVIYLKIKKNSQMIQ